MKKLNHLFVILVLTGIVFSCEKTELDQKQINPESLSVTSSDPVVINWEITLETLKQLLLVTLEKTEVEM